MRRVLNLSSCYVVAKIQAPNGKRGYVISVTELPENLFARRELTIGLVKDSLAFFRKISDTKTYVGLAAWWPIVTNSGLLFQKFLKDSDNINVTSGHTATLMSLYRSILKLADITRTPLEKSKVLILGVGKIGGALAVLLSNKVGKLGLLDKNPI